MRRRHTGLLFSILIAILLLCLPAIAGQGTDVDDETEIRRYARGSYVWPYSSGPHYGAVVEGFRREAGVLYTEVGSFRLEQGLPFPVELAIANQLDTLGAQYFVVQLEPDAAAKGGYLALKRLLEERGGGIERPLPTTAYVVRLDGESLRAIRVMPGLHAVEPYHPAFKLHPTIGRTPLMDADKAVSSIYDLEIELFSGESVDEVASRLARLGAHVIATRTAWVRADVPRSVLADVARIEGVDRILEHVPMTIQGEKTTVSIQTGRYGSGYAPFHVAGIDGGGQGQGNDPQSDAQRIMVLDTGIQLDAADLADTRTSTGVPGHDPANAANSDVHRKVLVNESTDQFGGAGDLLGCESGLTTHGHVVAATALGWATDELPGTWGGDGFTSPDFAGKHWKLDGVAPKALLVNYDAQVTGGRCQNLEPGELYDEFAGGSLGTSYNQHNAKLANFSWGSNATTYSTNSSLIDEFLFENKDAMVFIASGNTSCNGILLIGARTDDEPGGPRRHVRAQRPGTGETGGGEHGVFGGFGDALVLGHPATAKNALTIGASGAVNDFGPAAEETRACFSRVGPDPANPAQAGLMGGRIAPQLMAPGLDIGSLGLPSEFSCKSSDDDQSSPVECINTFGWPGTSFSAPAVTGAAALVRDYFAQGFFPDGTGNNPGNDNDEIGNVSGSLVKAILINSADFLSCNGRNDFLTLRAGRTRDCPRESYLKDRYRFNHEQGYGRVKLDNALPLENWSPSASCLRVKDTSPPFFVSNIDGPDATAQTIDAVAGETHTMTFDVNHRRKELRITLAWLDEPGVALINDLDLELISPSGRVYFGNFFTEDDDRDGVLSTVGPDAEDCGGFDCPGCSGNGVLEESEWSLPLCFRDDLFPRHDHANPTEAIFLSPDPDGDFKTLDAHNQIELGTWILEVRANGGGTEAALPYALAISGPTCAQSQIAWVDDAFSCSGTAGFTLIEADESGDAVGGLTTAEVESRLVVQVIDSTGSILDEEAFFVPLGQSLTLESGSTWTGDFPLSGETARDAYNGVLDVRHGDIVRLVYADENNGLADPDRVRNAEALVNCRVDLSLSSLSFNTFGTNLKTEVRGGCERNERVTHRCAGDPQISCTSNSNCGGNGPCSSTGANTFDFGAPDPYLDAGESVVLGVAVEPRADVDLHHLEASLRCVEVNDITADEDCAPGSPSRVGCTDPLRESHTPCPGYMTIFNSPSTIDYAAAGQPVALEFPIQMANFISGEPDVEFVLDVTARASGKTAEGTVVARKRLDVDEVCKAYSTDYLTGGTEVRDYNNNQLIEYLTESDDYNQDYRFETRVFEDATVTGKNLGLQTPWNFDLNDGGFRSGLGDETDESTIADTIAQWGEDKNFNNVEDRRCNGNPLVSCAVNLDCINLNAGTQCVADEDRDPFNGQLDQNWSTLGGCGWQTKAPGSCALNPNIFCYTDDDCVPFGAGTCTGSEPVTGGAWHTGRIGGTSGACLVQGNMPGQCQTFETISGSTGESLWFELLLTPVIERVNADSAVRITHWGWNQSIDLPDEHTCMTWEFDVDVDDGREDLTRDLTVLNFIAGPYGPVTDTGGWKNPDGYPAFAPLDAQGNSQNGTSADIVQPPSTVITTNRHGKNSCFFESGVVPDTRDELALAGPPDDDLSNGYCKEPPFKSCLPGTCGDAGPCIIASPFIDEHVRPWGPERNMDASSFFGPDLRFATLEDIYGATGARFQAGLGLITFEKPGPADADPQAGFGVAIDDMVIEWEECTQGADAVDCSLQGWCATASLDSRRLFAGSGRLRITVLEPSHDQNTDCDLDGVGGRHRQLRCGFGA
ncbi:MAG: S8 family serine peptidase [bacterium]|nr:S8 family serine peptidase [bacterium]